LKLKEDKINSEEFKELFLSIIPTKNSLVVCYQGGDPELEISVKAFLDKPTAFFSRPETWILTTDKKWIIEYIWEQKTIRFINIENRENPKLQLKVIIE